VDRRAPRPARLRNLRPSTPRRALLGIAALLVTGCATEPQMVAGSPAPLPPMPSSAADTPGATRSPAPPGSTEAPGGAASSAGPTADGPAPVLPAAYRTIDLAAHGVTAAVPVPAGWARRSTDRGYEFGDPSGTVLLRLEITARTPGRTERESWQDLEAHTAPRLRDYRRLDVREVSGYPDGALDWSFSFDGVGGRRQVVDRLVASGSAEIAVYFSALQRDFATLRPAWDRASQGLTVS
jgi:hypothetical protein